MNNQAFTQKNMEEKRDYLTAFLRSSPGGALDERLIDSILPSISIDRQYSVMVYSDFEMFQEAVARTYAGSGDLYLAFPSDARDQAAAVITPYEPSGPGKHSAAADTGTPCICIWKGAGPCEKAQKNA